MADATKEAEQVKDRASEHGQEVAQHASENAQAVKETAKQQASMVADQAIDHGRNVLADLRGELSGHADTQASRASRSLRDLSSELDQMVGSSSGQGPAHDLVREVADRTGRVAERLDRDGVNGVLEDVQRFARRRPGLFLLAAAGTGFAVGRLVRNTDLDRLKEAAGADRDPGTGQHGTDVSAVGGSDGPSPSLPGSPGPDPALPGATSGSAPGRHTPGEVAPLRGSPDTVNPS